MKFLLGIFSDPYRNCDSEVEKKTILHKDHRSLARAVAQESIVLLKNDKNILPLRKDLKTIAVVGPLADNREDPLGAWRGVGKSKDVVTVLAGIRQMVSPRTTVLYAKGSAIDSVDTTELARARNIASRAEVLIVVVGEAAHMSGEASSRTDLSLPNAQDELVKAMRSIGKPIVIVLMNGRPLVIPWLAENVHAILETWFLGVETGNAVADVLFGDVNPSGKLPVTFPRSVGQIPIYYNHKNTGRPPSDDHYTSKYIDSPVTPLYPFGYGLSYTSFQYTDLRLNFVEPTLRDTIKVSATVQNTGPRPGDEIVQLYIRDKVGIVTRPVKELKAFSRVSLRPGESKNVEFTLLSDQLAFYNQKMERVIEPGEFSVFVGGNSVDLLEARFILRTR